MGKTCRQVFSKFVFVLVLALLFTVPTVTQISAEKGDNKVSATVNGGYVDDYESVTAALTALSGQYTTTDSYLFELNANVTEELSFTDYDSITIDLMGKDYEIEGALNIDNSSVTIKDSIKSNSKLIVSLTDDSAVFNGSKLNILTSSVSFEDGGLSSVYFGILENSVVSVSGSFVMDLEAIDIYDGGKLLIGKDLKVQRTSGLDSVVYVLETGSSLEIGGVVTAVTATRFSIASRANFTATDVNGMVEIYCYDAAVILVKGNITSTMIYTIVYAETEALVTVKGNIVAMELETDYGDSFYPSVIGANSSKVVVEGSITTNGIGISQINGAIVDVLGKVNAGTIAVVSMKIKDSSSPSLEPLGVRKYNADASFTKLNYSGNPVVIGKTSSLPIDFHPDSSITTIEGDVTSAKLAEMFRYGAVVINGKVTTNNDINFITFHDYEDITQVTQKRSQGVLTGNYFVYSDSAIFEESYVLIKNASRDIPTGINSDVILWAGLGATAAILFALTDKRKKYS